MSPSSAVLACPADFVSLKCSLTPVPPLSPPRLSQWSLSLRRRGHDIDVQFVTKFTLNPLCSASVENIDLYMRC